MGKTGHKKPTSIGLLAILLVTASVPVRAGTEPRTGAAQAEKSPGTEQIFGFDNKVPITTSSAKALKDFLTGRDLLDKLRARDSRPYFERAVEADRGFAMGFLYLSFVQADNEKARLNIDIAFTLSDHVSDGERLWIAGVKAGADGFPLKQRGYFRKLVHLYPEDERVRTMLGNTFFAQQDIEPAIEQYEKALAINPDYSPPYNQLGYSYSLQGDYPRAQKILKKYIQLIPDDPNPYDSYAELLLRMGKYDESIETYRKALAIHPGFMASYVGIASNLVLKGEYEAARDQLDKLYAEAQNDGERRMAHFATAVSYIDEGNIARGLEQFMKQYALAEMAGDTISMAGDLVLIGNVLLETGKIDDAAAWYGKAVKLVRKSDLPEGQKANAERFYLFNGARVDLMKDDVAAAKVKYEKFVREVETARNPFQVLLAHQLGGMIALAEGDFDRAIGELQKANGQDPYNLYRMALAYEGKGDWTRAAELSEQVIGFNGITTLNYAFSRNRARALRAELSERSGLERKTTRAAPVD